MSDTSTWASPGSAPSEDTPRAPAPEPADSEALGPGVEADVPLRPLGVAEILDGAIANIRRNPGATLGLALIPTSAVQVAVTLAQYFFISGQTRDEVTPDALARSLGWQFLAFVCGLLLTAYVILLLSGTTSPVAARALAGRSTSFADTWHATRPALVRLVGVATLVMVVVLVALSISVVPIVAAAAGGAPVAVGIIAAVIGIPLGFLLMVYAYVWFAPAAAIVTLERHDRRGNKTGVLAALRRSRRLVAGRWWRTFGVLALALVITVVIGMIVLPLPFSIAQSIILTTSGTAGWSLVLGLAVGTIGHIVAGTLTNPFNAGVIALLYADRRMRREGLDLDVRLDADPPEDPLDGWLPGPLTEAASAPRPSNTPSAPPMAPVPGGPPVGAPPYGPPPYGPPSAPPGRPR